jgi:hypothetical protein
MGSLRVDAERAPLFLAAAVLALALVGIGARYHGDDESREAGIVQDARGIGLAASTTS